MVNYYISRRKRQPELLYTPPLLNSLGTNTNSSRQPSIRPIFSYKSCRIFFRGERGFATFAHCKKYTVGFPFAKRKMTTMSYLMSGIFRIYYPSRTVSPIGRISTLGTTIATGTMANCTPISVGEFCTEYTAYVFVPLRWTFQKAFFRNEYLSFTARLLLQPIIASYRLISPYFTITVRSKLRLLVDSLAVSWPPWLP